MSKLKQRVQSFKTAQIKYNNKKVALSQEFTTEMHKALKAKDFKRFDDLKTDYRIYFGESGEFTIVSIEVMYGLI
jgi:hypothetical protein